MEMLKKNFRIRNIYNAETISVDTVLILKAQFNKKNDVSARSRI